MGDPAGIGPEIVARAVASTALRKHATLLVAGHPEILDQAARRVRPAPRFRVIRPDEDWSRDLRGTPLVDSGGEGWDAVHPGSGNAASGRMAALAIETAARLATSGR